MSEKNNIEHEYTTDLICPYCGHGVSDSWEYRDDDGTTGEVECGGCGKDFNYETHVDVTFSTSKIKESK